MACEKLVLFSQYAFLNRYTGKSHAVVIKSVVIEMITAGNQSSEYAPESDHEISVS